MSKLIHFGDFFKVPFWNLKKIGQLFQFQFISILVRNNGLDFRLILGLEKQPCQRPCHIICQCSHECWNVLDGIGIQMWHHW